jgi:glycerol-3-phosphate acyltransferase PlsX
MIIAIDATGGEYAPHETVKGAIKAAQEYEVDIALLGNKTVLHVLCSRYLNKLNISITEASEVIGSHESPVKAIRSKPNSAIVVGTKMIKDGSADAFVSAGSTGAVLAAALFNLGKIKGEPVLLIDAGANADCRPTQLVQFARLGAIYCQQIIGISTPRIGLLSNGEEETKGSQLVKETHQLLKMTDLNFIGNIEGQDIPDRKADIIVTDGFTGNIVLKTIEGMGDTFVNSLRQVGHVFTNAYRLQGRALLQDLGLAKRVDYREYGGACLLGLNGNVIITHGRSQAKAIKNAIGLAKQTAAQSITQLIKEDTNERTSLSK